MVCEEVTTENEMHESSKTKRIMTENFRDQYSKKSLSEAVSKTVCYGAGEN